MRRTISILICVFTALIARTPALASLRLPPEPIEHAVGMTPLDAEMVIVIDGLSITRNLPAASGLYAALNDLGLVESIKPNWTALSTLLGWTETETLDRLFGSRVTLVIQSVSTGEDTPWVILSDISDATGQRLRERIPIAPRKAVEGQPVFALERGEYEMATVRLADKDEGGGRVKLLLGPIKGAALFDAMVLAINKGGAKSLAATPIIAELAGHAAPGIIAAVRLDPPGGAAPRPAWSDFLLCAATPRGRSWECKITLRDSDTREHVAAVQPTSDAAFRAMSRSAMLAVIETSLAEPGAEPSNFFERFLALFTLPQSQPGFLTGRKAIAVWPRSEAPKDAPVTGITPIHCAVALETRDVDTLAPVGDKHLGRLIEQIEKVFGGPGLPVPDFAGVSSEAVRTVGIELPADARRVFDGPVRVAWSYPVAATNTPPAAPDTRKTPRAGWWQICVGGAGQNDDAAASALGGGSCAEAARRMVESLRQLPEAGDTARWVSLGLIKPADWSGILKMIIDSRSEAFPQAAGLLQLFNRVDHVEWRLAARDNADISGVMRIEMAADAAPR